MAEAAFSEDGKYYSALTGDGRLNIWDTESNELKQQYTPDLHLTSPPSCLQWLTVSLSVGHSQKQKKSLVSISENETQCIALGTHSGKILLYSVAQAKIETVLTGRGNTKITALDWNRQYGLYSCSKDDYIVEWDIQSGHSRSNYKIAVENKSKQQNCISAIKIVPHSLETEAHYLVAASWQVRLWRLHQGNATIVKTLGHNASQTALLSLARVNDACWLIQGSQNERLLSFWDITITEDHIPITNGDGPTSKKKRKRNQSLTNVPVVSTPTYNFVLEDAPRIVDADLKDDNGTIQLRLTAATRSGVVHYYAHTLNGSSVKPMKPSVTVQASTAAAAPLPLQACRLRPGGLLLAYTHGPHVLFENVTPDLKTKTQVLIRGDSKPSRLKSNSSAATKVRSDKGPQSQVQIVEALGGVAGRKRVMPGGQVEVAMEARLANLSLEGARGGAVNENYTRLLAQGLHSKDREIIETVLLKGRMEVARRTLAALPAESVPLLLHELARMADNSTRACLCVCTWLQALLQCHSALLLALMSSPHADVLARLLAIFTNRRSHLCQLLNLQGRLELTIQQRNASSKKQHSTKAMLEYKDASSDEELMVNERSRSDSEGSWGDDKFASDDNGNSDDEMEQDRSDSSEDEDE